MSLVLSLFPGIGLLDMAFEAEGFCVVRGPDLLWGGDIHRFHPPPGVFEGVIGGPPCQAFSSGNVMARLGLKRLAPNLIPEFERCIREAQPAWFLMENVPPAPLPNVGGWQISSRLVNQRWVEGATEQNRRRRFSFGTRDGRPLHIAMAALEPIDKAPCFTANATQWNKKTGHSRSQRTRAELRRGLRLQGLPENHLERAPFTVEGAIRVVGNGVPLPMGRAIARGVREALERADAA